MLLNLANEQTKVIPGSGPVQTQADLKELANMMDTLRVRFYDMIGKGMTCGRHVSRRADQGIRCEMGRSEAVHRQCVSRDSGITSVNLGREAHGIV